MSSSPSSFSYRPSLDGLRMLAMYVIVLFHTQVTWIQGGFIAVNLFFVLSGYLVSNVILSEMDRTGRLDLGRFYARRVRRLLPAAVVAVVGTCLLFVLVAPVVRRVALIADAQSSLLYFANWRFVAQANDYFATDVEKSPFLHYWTLSIEEQFYVVFPLLILLLARPARRWAMFAGMAAIFLLSVGAQLYWAGVNPMHAYYGTDARAYQLAAGALLAVGLRTWPPQRVPQWTARGLAVGGLLAFVLLCLGVGGLGRSWHGIAGTLACVALIAGLMLGESQLLGRIFAGRTAVYLGQISYATYLWHWPAILVLGQILEVGPVLMAILAGIIATAMSAASAEIVELPIRKAAVLNAFKWRTAVVGVGVSALVAATLVPAVLEREREPALVAGKNVETASARLPSPKIEKVPDDVDWQAVERDRGKEHSCTEQNPRKCVVHRGTGPHILLVGDSHAMMMAGAFTELAKKHDFTLSLNIVPGCPWQENLKNVNSSPKRQDRCTDARAGWYDDVLPKLDPDLVVTASLPRDRGRWHRHLETRDGGDEPLKPSILHATQDTLAKIDDVADRTLMVESIVTPQSFTPNDCLTTRPDPADCIVPLSIENRPTDGYYLAAAAKDPDFYTVDLNPAFCPDAPLCAPIVDGTIVWRDHLHLTTTYATSRKDEVWKLIRETDFLKEFKSL